MNVQVSDRAIEDLLAIAERLSDFSISGALAVVDSYDRVLEQLRDFPLSGQASQVAVGMRVIRTGVYRFLYFVSEDRVVLARILDGRGQHDLP